MCPLNLFSCSCDKDSEPVEISTVIWPDYFVGTATRYGWEVNILLVEFSECHHSTSLQLV